MEGVIGTHLIGSVPRPDTESVFREVLSLVPNRLKRITDGETGDRSAFTLWQYSTFSVYPAMLAHFEGTAMITDDSFTAAQIAEGIATLRNANIETGYDKAAIESYAIFQKLRTNGSIPNGVELQACIPSVGNVLMPFVQRAFAKGVETIYEERLFHAMRNIQNEIPHEDLSIQIDIAADTACWEAVSDPSIYNNLKTIGMQWLRPWWDTTAPDGDVKTYLTNSLARQICQVDDDVEVGLHNCYGDIQHQHFYEPRSLAVIVDRAQHIWSALASHRPSRTISYFHCPVPKSAESYIDAYLAPLKDLIPLLRQHGTELILGLVHEYKPDLTKAYIEAAKRFFPAGFEFAVAAECGGGRMDWEAFSDVLKISAEVAKPVM